MSNLYASPCFVTFGELTATKLISLAKIVKTQSNDFYIRVNDVDLRIVDRNMMSVSSFGNTICTMTLSKCDYAKLEKLEDKVEEKYDSFFSGVW